MKRVSIVLVSLIVLMGIIAGCASTKPIQPATPPPSNVIIKEVGNTKLHSFLSSSVSPVIIETRRNLIVIDFPGDNEDNRPLFKQYVDSLNKPIERYFISHIDASHWVGIEAQFPGMTFYSVDADAIKAHERGGALNISKIADGSSQRVAGINLVFEVDRGIQAWIIKMPDLKAAYIDHIGYVNLHVLLPPLADFPVRAAHLRRLVNEGHTYFMPGHGRPVQGIEFADQVERYYNDVTAAVRNSSTVEEAKATIMRLHPEYNSPAMLDRFLPQLKQW